MFAKRKKLLVRDTISIAGWLFADLLLGLSMLFLVFNTVGVNNPIKIALRGLRKR